MRAQLSCNFSKIKMDWSWHYQVNNEAILVKQKKLSDMWWKATMPGSEKIWKREKKRAQNPTNITHPTDQGKKREKISSFRPLSIFWIIVNLSSLSLWLFKNLLKLVQFESSFLPNFKKSIFPPKIRFWQNLLWNCDTYL